MACKRLARDLQIACERLAEDEASEASANATNIKPLFFGLHLKSIFKG